MTIKAFVKTEHKNRSKDTEAAPPTASTPIEKAPTIEPVVASVDPPAESMRDNINEHIESDAVINTAVHDDSAAAEAQVCVFKSSFESSDLTLSV